MNRHDMKEWFRVFKRAQQDEFVGKQSSRNSLNEMNRHDDTSPHHDQQLNIGMFSNDMPQTGDGIGRGQEPSNEEKLKNALADLYQEVVAAEEDEIDPSDYRMGSSMDMMGDANFEAVSLIRMIVDKFLEDKY